MVTATARPIRILVSDPSPVEAATTAALLEGAGYAVRIAPRTALVRSAREERPDVIVLADPVRAFIDELRHFPSTARCGIVAVVGGAVTGASGADAAVELPMNAHELLAAVGGLAAAPRRRPVAFDITLHRAWGARIAATAMNLSETGILVKGELPADVGEPVLLEGTVPRGSFMLGCLVARHAEEHGPTHLGLRFSHPRAVVRHAMEAFQI